MVDGGSSVLTSRVSNETKQKLRDLVLTLEKEGVEAEEVILKKPDIVAHILQTIMNNEI